MGEAILSRLVASNIYLPSDVCVSDPMPERRALLEKKYGVQVTPNNLVAAEAEIMLLAVKPQPTVPTHSHALRSRVEGKASANLNM